MRRTTRLLAAVVATWLIGVFVPATPAGAQTDVDVTTPADGWYQPGNVTPFIVTIEADGAASGTIRVEFEQIVLATKTFEIAGGSTKRIVVSAPTLPWGGFGNVIVDTGDDIIRAQMNLNAANADELVGVLPALAGRGLEATADLTVDTGQARLFAFDPVFLDSGPEALGAFTYVVAAVEDLDDLGPRLEAVEDWVADGGRLVVDTAPETPLPFDPGEPLGGSNSIARYRLGSGSVEFTNGVIAASGFDDVIAPSASVNTQNTPFGGFGTMPATPYLAADAGVRVPEIGSIVLFLLAYIAIAGPIAYALIRRRNREPALWLIVPGLAVLATAGVWIFGRELRDNVNSAHATLVVDQPVGRTITTQTLVAAPGGGLVGVELPDDWRQAPASFDDMMMGMEFGGGLPVANPIQQDGELVVDLAPGGVGVVHAETRRPINGDRAWDVTLDLVDDELVGTVTNLTEHTLTSVTISSGQSIQRISSISAGETVEVKVSRPGRYVTGEDPLMSQMWQIDMSNNTSPVNPSVLSTWLTNNPSIAAPDNVLVLGWTRDAAGPLETTSGRSVTDGRTGFMAVEPITASNDLIGPATNRVRILRGWETTRVIDDSRAQWEEFAVTMQITPTSDPTDRELVIAVPRFVAAMDVWNGDEWLPAGMVDIVGDSAFALPSGAFDDGSLYVRFQLGDEWWGRSDVFPSLRMQIPDDEVLVLQGADDV